MLWNPQFYCVVSKKNTEPGMVAQACDPAMQEGKFRRIEITGQLRPKDY
jgi:hypothetical protein